MAKMKKVLAIAMAAAMGMSMLAGCGDQKKGDADVVSSAEKTEAEQTEATEEVTTEETTEAATTETTEPDAEEKKKESKGWIGIAMVAGVLTMLLAGAMIVRGIGRRNQF